MKIGLFSLGCPKNLVDSEVMLGLAQQAGHELTSNAGQAEVLVVNTCAFIDKARQESVDAILEMAEHKKTGACRRLVVTGCLAERYRDELAAEIPEIDAILGTGEVPRILEALSLASALRKEGTEASANVRLKPDPTFGGSTNGSATSSAPLAFFRERPRADTHGSALPTYIYDADTPRRLTTPRHFAYLKIAEGCDYKCSFCIIPTLRGRYRSRPAESIVREARALAERGVRELILISQDTTFYGIDRGERGALARLLRELNRVDGLEWIRMLYLYPTTIDDGVMAAMAECDKICKYVDLPLQHASTGVLRRMRRPGSRGSYERLLQRIRARVPGVALRTTFIVGFPGESDSDFDELCAFVRSTEFDHLGVFTYSREEGTSAHALYDDVPARTKNARRRQLMSLQKQLVGKAHKRRIGWSVRVLVDGPSPDHELVLSGRLEGQAPDIDPMVYLTDCDPSSLGPGDFIEARIVGARDYDLVAQPLS